MSDRFKNALDLGAALAGLAGYLLVLGGIVQWVKLRAAGLPADVSIGAYGSQELAASGLRALAVLPIVFAALLVLAHVYTATPRGQRTAAARFIDRVDDVVLPTLVIFEGLIFGASSVAGMAEAAAGHDAWITRAGLAAAFSLLQLSLLVVPVLLVIGGRAIFQKIRGKATSGPAAAEGQPPHGSAAVDG